MSSADEAKASQAPLQKAQETVEIAYELSRILNTGLDRETLSILMGLCECGVNPEALAHVVKELRREGEQLRAEEDNQ